MLLSSMDSDSGILFGTLNFSLALRSRFFYMALESDEEGFGLTGFFAAPRLP